MSQTFDFFVPGQPATKGSFIAMTNRHTGKPFVKNSNVNCKDWQHRIALAAKEAGVNHYWEHAVTMKATFYLKRPKGHFGTGRNAEKLKASAPTHHCKKPDIDKLLRALLDGLTNVAYRDDSQIIDCHVRKKYGQALGVHVCITFHGSDE